MVADGDMWDAGEYLRFGDVRLRYALDLIVHVDATRPQHIVDLGCGPETVTAEVARRWPGAHVLGIDSSGSMIDTARSLIRELPAEISDRIEFRQGDLRGWEPADRVDVLLANSVLHWIPGHRSLLPRFASFLSPGGVLGFQMPVEVGRIDRILFGLCGEDDWREKLADVPGLRAVDDPADYLHILADAGLRADTWQISYTLVADYGDGRDGVVDQLMGTMLRPVLTRLSEAEKPPFLKELTARVRQAYPPAPLAGRQVQIVPELRSFGTGRKPA